LRGEHKRIRLQNEQEAKLSLDKAQEVKDQFIQKQLSERRMLMLRHKTRQQQQQIKQRELRQDIERYKQGQLERVQELSTLANAKTLDPKVALNSESTIDLDELHAAKKLEFTMKRRSSRTYPPKTPTIDR